MLLVWPTIDTPINVRYSRLTSSIPEDRFVRLLFPLFMVEEIHPRSIRKGKLPTQPYRIFGSLLTNVGRVTRTVIHSWRVIIISIAVLDIEKEGYGARYPKLFHCII